jgi:Fe-S oxidoreductase
MAGSFGYKKEYYELSMKVGQELDEQLASEDAARTVVASGTSCQEQIGALINQPVAHPIEVIAPDGY